MVKIAIIGDVHGAFKHHEVEYFNSSDDALILITGDIENLWGTVVGHVVARRIAKIRKPLLAIPGNHDGTTPAQLAAEMANSEVLANISGRGHRQRVEKLRAALGSIEFDGYRQHHFAFDGVEPFDVIVGRPFSMGGEKLGFAQLLRELYDVSTMADSAMKLRELVDASESPNLIFLSHNGPTGLGSAPGDLWGRDFGRREGDHGDPDLAEAIDYARDKGKRIVAVVTGHMHHALRGGGTRLWHVEQEGIHYINAAKVPRTFSCLSEEFCHYVRLEWEGSLVTVEENFITRDLRV